MTSAGSGVFQEPPELARTLGGSRVPDGFERLIVEILHEGTWRSRRRRRSYSFSEIITTRVVP